MKTKKEKILIICMFFIIALILFISSAKFGLQMKSNKHLVCNIIKDIQYLQDGGWGSNAKTIFYFVDETTHIENGLTKKLSDCVCIEKGIHILNERVTFRNCSDFETGTFIVE